MGHRAQNRRGFLVGAPSVGVSEPGQGLALCLLTPALLCGVKLLSAGLELRHFHLRVSCPGTKEVFPCCREPPFFCWRRRTCPLPLNRALPPPPYTLSAGAGGGWRRVGCRNTAALFRLSPGVPALFTADAVSLLSGDGLQAAARETQAQYQSKLTLDAGPDSRKTGCARFNELFVRRNYRLLMRPARRTAVIAGAALAPGCAACLALPEIAAAINGALVPALPMMLLLMYFINRGNTVTQYCSSTATAVCCPTGFTGSPGSSWAFSLPC